MIDSTPRVVARRRGFTIVEISVGLLVTLLVFLMAFSFFSSGRRGYQHLTEDLDLNSQIERALHRLSRDVRGASRILGPAMIPVDQAPPDFELGKTTDLALLQITRDFSSSPITEATSLIRYSLEEPEEAGNLSTGEEVITYTLFRTAGSESPLPPGKPILRGVRELVFYRTLHDPAAGGATGTGPSVLNVIMKVSQVRKDRKGNVFFGYTAELATSIRARGTGR